MPDIQKVPAEELMARLKADPNMPSDAQWVFDCDGTLIHGDIASLTAWGLIRFGLAHPEQLPEEWQQFSKLPFDYAAFRRLRNLIIERRGVSAIYEWEAFLHAGLPPSASYDMAKVVIREGEQIGVIGFEKYLSQIAAHHKDRTWIVSGSPDICVAAIAERLGVPRARVIGTMLETVDGIYAPRIQEPGIIWEELKRQALKEQGVTKPWFVAGDTIGDWQMMEMSARWCWAAIWGVHRHRGEEFREALQTRVLGAKGPRLPDEPGLYTFDNGERTWVFEVKAPPTQNKTGEAS